jgi:metal transporter CNNM
MAIVSRISVEKAASVKKVVKRGLTQRLRDRVGMGESDSSDEEGEVREKVKVKVREREKGMEDGMSEFDDMDGEATLKGDPIIEHDYATSNSNSNSSNNGGGTREKGVSFSNARGRGRSKGKNGGGDTRQQQQQQNVDLEMGIVEDKNKKRSSFVHLPFAVAGLEQSMPADAVLAKESAEEVSNIRGALDIGLNFGRLLVLAGYRSCGHAIGYHHSRRRSGRYILPLLRIVNNAG